MNLKVYAFGVYTVVKQALLIGMYGDVKNDVFD